MTAPLTSSKSASKSAPLKTADAAPQDAISLLKADHAAVSRLFAEFVKTSSPGRKKSLAAEICTMLTVHAQIEEEIFYPAVKAMNDAKVKVLSEYVKHPVKEEQDEMFQKSKDSSLCFVKLGEQMAARKKDLLAMAP